MPNTQRYDPDPKNLLYFVYVYKAKRVPVPYVGTIPRYLNWWVPMLPKINIVGTLPSSK